MSSSTQYEQTSKQATGERPSVDSTELNIQNRAYSLIRQLAMDSIKDAAKQVSIRLSDEKVLQILANTPPHSK